MPSVSFIVCSAGLGQRMQCISQTTPKHLLFLDNKRLLEWSLDSLPFRENDQLILIAQNNAKSNELSDSILQSYAKKFKISTHAIYINSVTRGQAETALLAEPVVRHPRIAVFNSDTYFQCPQLDAAIHHSEHFGIAPCYKTTGDEWSFFKTENDGPFYSTVEVKEKIKISDWCSTGFYFFKEGNQFFASVQNILANPTIKQELYIAPLYNQFLNLGVKVLDCTEFKPMGTPNQLNIFWKTSVKQMVHANAIG